MAHLRRASPMTAGKHKRQNRNKKNRRVNFDVSEGSHEEWTTTGSPEEKSKSAGGSLLKRIDSFLKDKSSAVKSATVPKTSLLLSPQQSAVPQRKKSQMPARDLLEILDRRGGNDQESISTLSSINERIEAQHGFMARLQMREDFITLGLNLSLHRFEKSRKTSAEMWREIHRFRDGENRDAAAEGERRVPIDVFWQAYARQREGGHSNLVLDLLERLSHRPFTQHELQVLIGWASSGRESLHAIPTGIVSGLHPHAASSSAFLQSHPSPSASPPPSDPEIRREGEARSAKKELFEMTLEETNIRQVIPRRARSMSRKRPSKHTVTDTTRMPPLSIDCSSLAAGGSGDSSREKTTDASILLSPVQKISSGIAELRRQESAPPLLMETPAGKSREMGREPLPSPILREGEERRIPVPLPHTSTPSAALPSISKNAPPPPPPPPLAPLRVMPCASSATSSSTTSTSVCSSSALPSISATAPPPPPLPPFGSSVLRPTILGGMPPPPPPLPPGGLLLQRGGPPPPPPPLPPGGVVMRRGAGGPPPPPPIGGFIGVGAVTPRVRELKKERNTLSVLWESVPSLHDESLWSERSEADINEDEMEELQRSFERRAVSTRSVREKRAAGGSGRESSAYALTQSRAMTIEITLKNIKKKTEASFEVLLDRLERDELGREQVELLEQIIKNYPTDNELAPFKPLQLEGIVGDANRFCWHVSRRPTLRIKAQLLIARETLSADLKSEEATMGTLKAGIGAAKSEVIKNILLKVLNYGNYLNQGTANRRADGFSISSLIAVLNIRGLPDEGAKRFVDVLANHMRTSREEVSRVLTTLSTASKIDLDEVCLSLNETKQSLTELKSALRKSEDKLLQEKYREFIEGCDARCVALIADMEDIRKKECSLRVFFGVPTLSLMSITKILAEALELFKKSLESSELKRFHSMRAPSQRKDSTLGVPGASLLSSGKRRQSMMTVDDTSRLFSRALDLPTAPSATVLPTIRAASAEVQI